MHWLALGILFLGGFLFLIRWLGTAEPSRIARTAKWSFVALFMLAAGGAILTGRAAFAIPLLVAGATTLLTRLGSRADTRHAGDGRADGRTGSRSGQMSRSEALDVLGLDEGADPNDIHEAHRRLIRRLHPDQGGSDYLAAKLNEAKDVLLGRK